MIQKLKASVRGFIALMLMLFATNLAPVAAAYAATSTDVVWGQQGRDKADPNCKAGQTANFHFILAGAGTDITNAGTITVGFSPSGSDTDTGTIHAANGNSKASATYDVSGSYDAVATTATVTGATWDNGNGQNSDMPLLTLSSSSCTGTPLQTVTAGEVTYVDLCGTANDSYTVPTTSHVTYSQSAGLHSNATGTVTVTASADQGYVLTAPYTFTHTFTNVACPPTDQEIPVPAMPNTTDECGPNNAEWVKPADTAQVTWSITQSGHLIATTTAGYVFPGNETTHDYGKAVETNTQPCKVFVCKYVGIPGVNERLKAGKNPISVSVNATGGAAVGSYFSDAQGRSYVLGVDDGVFNPSRDDCPATHNSVNPGEVTFTQPTCEVLTGSYTIPSTTGVKYKVSLNGGAYQKVAAGSYTVAAGSTVQVKAFAKKGYVLTGTTTWSSDFPAATDCTLGDTDVCPNITGDQATVPAGMTKDNSGNCVTPGGQGGDEGVVLSASTTATPQLANTGDNSLASIITGLVAIVMAVGLTLASRKQLSR
jgi:hypothetical protein